MKTTNTSTIDTKALAEQYAREAQAKGGNALRAEYQALTGEETKSHNKPFLVRTIVRLRLTAATSAQKLHEAPGGVAEPHSASSEAPEKAQKPLASANDETNMTATSGEAGDEKPEDPETTKDDETVREDAAEGDDDMASKKSKAARGNRKAQRQPQMRKRAERDERLPRNGTVLEREIDVNGKNITVKAKVTADGFEYKGKIYKSLSAIAKEATGTVWNGYLFFKLQPYAKRAVAE